MVLTDCPEGDGAGGSRIVTVADPSECGTILLSARPRRVKAAAVAAITHAEMKRLERMSRARKL
jgi:hypothetical protein